MLRPLKKALAVLSLTAVGMTGLSLVSSPAFADTAAVNIIQPPPPSPVVQYVKQVLAQSIGGVTISTALPLCYGVADTLHDGTVVCINTVTLTGAQPGQFGYFVTTTGSVTVCYLGNCPSFPFSSGANGVGIDLNKLVPQIIPGPSVPVVIPVGTCIGSLYCTPRTVWVPSYQINFFPPSPTPLASYCVANICGASPLAPLTVGTGSLASLISVT